MRQGYRQGSRGHSRLLAAIDMEMEVVQPSICQNIVHIIVERGVTDVERVAHRELFEILWDDGPAPRNGLQLFILGIRRLAVFRKLESRNKTRR